MRPEYEQMELDTRKALDIAIYKVAEDAVATAREMVEASQVAPSMVRNRHEAYGIAAEQYSRIAKAVSAIKADTATLLGTLADPNFPAIEATSSIANSTMEAAATIIKAAAEMKRTLANLYIAETKEPGPRPWKFWQRKAAGTASRKRNRQRPGKSPGAMKTDPQTPGKSSAQRNKGGYEKWLTAKRPNWPPLAASS